MNERTMWMWLVIGLVPYSIKMEYRTGGGKFLEVRALFWWLIVYQRRNGRCDWKVRVALIYKLRDAVWSAITRLRGGEDNTLAEL